MGALVRTKRLLNEISMDISRLNAFFTSSKNLYNSRWAYPHELKNLLGYNLARPQTGLLLGLNNFDQPLAVRPIQTRRELGNLLLVAPTRSGKTLCATSQLLTWPHSVIINDLKGELFHQTAGYRSGFSDIFCLDPRGFGHAYDPLQGKTTEDELFAIATHLLYSPGDRDPIFLQRAIRMLTQILLAARLEDKPPLPYVNYMIGSGLLAVAAKLDTLSPQLSTKFLDQEFTDADFSDRFLQSAWSTLTTKLYPILTETVIRSLAGSSFKAEDLMRAKRPITVYIRVPEIRLLALSPLIRLLFGSFLDDLTATYDKHQGQGCRPVLLLADEAGRTAIPSLSDHSTTVVGRHIYLWIAVQSLSQLENAYGKTRAHVLRDNMENQIYYRPNNPETADYIEHALSKKSGFAHSQTSHQTQTTSSLSEQAIPLMSSWEIMRMSDEDIIGFHRSLPPFKARRMDWRRFPTLTQRLNLTTPPLNPLPKQTVNLPTTIWEEKKKSYIDYDRRN
jgi:type IV secretion system protein VirD4